MCPDDFGTGWDPYVGGVFAAMVHFVLHLEAQGVSTAETFRNNSMQALSYLPWQRAAPTTVTFHSLRGIRTG